MDLQPVDPIDFSDLLLPSDANSKWSCYLSMYSPLAGRKNGRNSFAAWLSSKEAGKKGLYIWLHVLPGGEQTGVRYRFVHVGLSKRGASTLASRTRAHCRNAFTTDPVYQLDVQDGRFGSLKEVAECGTMPCNKEEYVKRFLAQIHVLLIIPQSCKSEDVASMEGLIADAEGLIAHAAGCALGKDQITNTLTKVRRPAEKIDMPETMRLNAVVKRLNAVVPMLPEIDPNS